jgi:hypothetical protein
MLHESIAHTRKEVTIKESQNFRLKMVKHKVANPKGLFNVDIIQEELKQDGTVIQASTYNFFMTAQELQILSTGLTV